LKFYPRECTLFSFSPLHVYVRKSGCITTVMTDFWTKLWLANTVHVRNTELEKKVSIMLWMGMDVSTLNVICGKANAECQLHFYVDYCTFELCKYLVFNFCMRLVCLIFLILQEWPGKWEYFSSCKSRIVLTQKCWSFVCIYI